MRSARSILGFKYHLARNANIVPACNSVSVNTTRLILTQKSHTAAMIRFSQFSSSATRGSGGNGETKADETSGNINGPNDVENESTGESQIDLASTISKLESDVKDLQEKILRSYAEEENVRRIAKRDVENAKAYANTSFAKSILEVADNLERAIASVPDSSKTSNSDPNLLSLLEGVSLTHKGLLKVFRQFHIQKYGMVGEPFDPSLHEALFRIPVTTDQTPNTIGQILKSGYKLNDRVIRAAEVGVLVAPVE